MRIPFLSSLMFALLTSASVAVTAAPVAGSTALTDTPVAVVVQEHKMDRLNLNTADAQMLQKELVGIGKNKADAIVAYRDSNGSFTSVDELIEVKGIGKSILDKNRDKLSVE